MHWEFVIKNTKKSLKRRQTTEVTKHDRQNTYQCFLPDAENKPLARSPIARRGSWRGVKDFRFWSDNCAGQNRNRIVFSLYMFVAKKLGITVTHRFLEKGHTQNEGDNVHATVERYSKHKTIWVPEEWYCLVRWAKSEGDPYVVKEIQQDDIFDFKA